MPTRMDALRGKLLTDSRGRLVSRGQAPAFACGGGALVTGESESFRSP